MVDHIDGNGLNNQRSNLRQCSHQQNLHNQDIRIDTSTGYKGVHFNKESGKYRAQIAVNHKRHFLGSFADPAEAALAYDNAARKHHGEFCRVNFPQAHEQGVH